MMELLEKLKTLDKQKLIAFIAAFAIFLALDVVFCMNWQLKNAKAMKERIVQLKATIAETERSAQDQERKKQVSTQVRPKVKTAVALNDLPVLLQKISTVAKECNVRVNHIAHAKEARIAPGPGQPAQQQGLIPVSIRLDMLAGYHDFGRFLNALENAEEPMAAQDVKFTPDRAEIQKLRINLVLKTFVKG